MSHLVQILALGWLKRHSDFSFLRISAFHCKVAHQNPNVFGFRTDHLCPVLKQFSFRHMSEIQTDTKSYQTCDEKLGCFGFLEL